MLDYAGAELERDFHVHYQLDVLDFFRGAYPWAKFLRLVDQLPQSSAYRDKVLKDEELAAVVYQLEKAEPADGVEHGDNDIDLPFIHETVEVGLLRDVSDKLSQLMWVTAHASGQPPQPGPRPETAYSKIKDKEADQATTEALSLLLPHER